MANDKRDILRKDAIEKFTAREKLNPSGDDLVARADRMSIIAFGYGHDAGYAAVTAEGIPQSDVIDVLLWCPQCFEQHVDEAKPDVCEECGLDEDLCTAKGDTFRPWLNPSHKSHRCNFCNHVWRPSDTPTNGVLKLETQGKADGSAKPVAFANGKDFDDAVAIATKGSEWKAIETVDDLPKKSGSYLWEMKEGYYTEANHNPQVRNAAFYVERFRAWMSIPPYQHKSEGDSK